MNPQWTNKAEYLTFVAEWKAAYKSLSDAIREIKFCSRAGESLNTGSKRFASFSSEEIGRRHTEAGATFQKLRAKYAPGNPGSLVYITPRGLATYLLAVRAEQKELAKIAREESLKLVAVAS